MLPTLAGLQHLEDEWVRLENVGLGLEKERWRLSVMGGQLPDKLDSPEWRAYSQEWKMYKDQWEDYKKEKQQLRESFIHMAKLIYQADDKTSSCKEKSESPSSPSAREQRGQPASCKEKSESPSSPSAREQREQPGSHASEEKSSPSVSHADTSTNDQRGHPATDISPEPFKSVLSEQQESLAAAIADRILTAIKPLLLPVQKDTADELTKQPASSKTGGHKKWWSLFGGAAFEPVSSTKKMS